MEKHEEIRSKRGHIFFNNFLGGIAWGLGATVGLSIFLAIVAFLASKLDLIPIVGNFVSNVVTYILENNQQVR